MTKYTIEDLQQRKVSLHLTNKDSLNTLNIILNKVFYKSKPAEGTSYYYNAHPNNNKNWECSDIKPPLNIVTVDKFYHDNFTTHTQQSINSNPLPEHKILGYKLNGIATPKNVAALLECGLNIGTDTPVMDLYFNKSSWNKKYKEKAELLGILDIWFTPVYEEEKIEILCENGQSIMVSKETITFEDVELHIEFINQLLKPTKLPGMNSYSYKTESWWIGCVVTPKLFTRTDARNVLKAHTKLIQ